MNNVNAVLRAVLRLAARELPHLGFEPQSPSIFTRSIRDKFQGWIGLNHGSRGSHLEINPVVGVRSVDIERMVARLLNEAPHSYIPPTVATSLGYLLPQRSYTPWLFEQPDRERFDALIAAIKRYAIPFMEQNASVEALAKLLEDGKYSYNESTNLHLPVAYLLLGSREKATAFCRSAVADLGARTDLAAQQYRSFCEALQSA